MSRLCESLDSFFKWLQPSGEKSVYKWTKEFKPTLFKGQMYLLDYCET
jgi:hypothetical protein